MIVLAHYRDDIPPRRELVSANVAIEQLWINRNFPLPCASQRYPRVEKMHSDITDPGGRECVRQHYNPDAALRVISYKVFEAVRGSILANNLLAAIGGDLPAERVFQPARGGWPAD